MRPSRRLFESLVLLIAAAAPVQAEEPPPWNGNLEFSYLETSGNSNSQTLSTAGKLERAFSRSKLTAEGKAIYGEKDEITSDRNWSGSLKYDFLASDRMSVFALEAVERNVLKGLEFRYTHQGGLGYRLIKTGKDTLRLEVGAGYMREDRVDPFNDYGFPTARLFGGYLHSFDDKNRFEQTVEYLPNLREGEDYMINEVTSLISNLMGNLAMKVSFEVNYDNLPPPEFQKSDRIFKTALLYTF